MVTDLHGFTPVSDWGAWLLELAQLSSAELAEHEVADLNLRCAVGLPGADDSLLPACLAKVDEWAAFVDRFTQHVYPRFSSNPERFENSEARFRIMAMVDCLQREIGSDWACKERLAAGSV